MTDEPRSTSPDATATRRVFILGAAATGLLAACGSDEPTAGSGSTASGSGGAGTEVAKVSEVPVGGGVINADAGIVVTQPEAGTFKGFTNICTHQQCPVARVADGQIQCDCHGSRFSIEDGAPTPESQAKAALSEKPVSVEGDAVVLA